MNEELKGRIFQGEYIPLEDIADKAEAKYVATIYMDNIRMGNFVGKNLKEVEGEAYSKTFSYLISNNPENEIKIFIRVKIGMGDWLPLRGIRLKTTTIPQGRDKLLGATKNEA